METAEGLWREGGSRGNRHGIGHWKEGSGGKMRGWGERDDSGGGASGEEDQRRTGEGGDG